MLCERFGDAFNLLRFSWKTESLEHIPHGIRNGFLEYTRSVHEQKEETFTYPAEIECFNIRIQNWAVIRTRKEVSK